METSFRADTEGSGDTDSESTEAAPGRRTSRSVASMSGNDPGPLPNLVIIGAQKCATTSLHIYLGTHPEIHMSKEKELDFFARERNWALGEDWYRSHFSTRAKVNGESSTSYTAHPRITGSPELMHSLIPDARLIYLVRDPIERMISHWVHSTASGEEQRPIEESLLAPEPNHYLARSRYGMQLERYLQWWDPAQIMVLEMSEMDAEREATLRRVFRFLGVSEEHQSWRFGLRRHETRRKRRKTALGRWADGSAPVRWLRRVPLHLRWPAEAALFYPLSRPIPRPNLPREAREALAARLLEDLGLLESQLGRRFDHWSVQTGAILAR